MQPFTVPQPLATFFKLLPQYPHSLTMAQVLNLALPASLRTNALLPLHGKLICLRINDANIVFYFTLKKYGIKAMRAGNPDLAISANAHNYIQLALRKEDPDTLFFSRRLLMEGDTELGLLLKNTLDALELPLPHLQRFLPSPLLRFLEK